MSDTALTTDCTNAEHRGGHHAPGWLWCRPRGMQPTPRVHCGTHCHAYRPPAMAALEEQDAPADVEPEPDPDSKQSQESETMPRAKEIAWDRPAAETIADGVDTQETVGLTLIQWAEARIAEGQSNESIAKRIGCAGTTLRWAVDRRRRDAGLPELTSHRKPRAERVPEARPESRREPAFAGDPEPELFVRPRPERIPDPMTANDPAQLGNEQLECSTADFARAAKAFIIHAGMDNDFGVYLAGWLDRDSAA